ncbi:hypothetical protein [Halalkalibacter alkaliphilus]|uniref:Uncharacterized protein n=1 Tax=Halalkalibacter alkaliphilus TaxID=2917993 RepID=A0A9X2A2B7_9BACI|nr:hypothetical protein [Halalkalibacter alkaliphilus]MCL7746615.1 hypothetical protein [Halalkalibacter alkaliphilus]
MSKQSNKKSPMILKGSDVFMVTLKELREEFEEKLNRQLTTEEIEILHFMIDSQYHRTNEALA